MFEFEGNERYRRVRTLGEGATGVVYEVEDRERGCALALKTLKLASGEALYRMKREFRAMSDLSHPNLVSVYDLEVDPEGCFFTMELIEGVSFLEWCRPAGVRDDGRVRDALAQLVAAVSALHDALIVHRDLKPSNVLIDRDGRLVLLDFGLATGIDRDESITGRMVGTALYMAPEQAAGDPATAAADWYAVGVLLYEALTGVLPFDGAFMQILVAKQTESPVPVAQRDPGAPADLADLATALLDPDPQRRPNQAGILHRLAGGAPVVAAPRSVPSRTTWFAGRERELALLADAYRERDPDGCAAVVVTGPSGIGKSTLINHFLRDLAREEPATLCLSGRSYERENVAYRAMDGVIDELASHLLRHRDIELDSLTANHRALLRRLFPVLGRVPALAEAVARDIPDPQELRTEAFAGLRQLLRILAWRVRLVLFLDDLQWVDDNSIDLLADVFRPPDPPPVFLILSSRQDRRVRAETMGFRPRVDVALGLGRLLGALKLPTRDLSVGPLDPGDSRRLAADLLGGERPELAERVAREAAGSPFFIGELCVFLESTGAEQAVDLDEVLGQRIRSLTPRGREILELAAVAGQPLAQQIAATALGYPAEELSRDIRALRVARILRSAPAAGPGAFEPYHDRIRAAVRRQIDGERSQSLHRMLALALEQHGEDDPERLARHWRGAGRDDRSAELAELAAEQAVEAVDFARAARLYRMVLELGAPAGDERRALLTSLGEALANAGRPEDAAAAFGSAAEGADPTAALDLRNRAAGELLRGGYLEEGLAALREVLAEIDLRLAATPGRALVALLGRRAWLRLRGLRWRRRDAAEIAQSELTRLDILASAAVSLSVVDNIRGADFQARHVLMALRVGEPTRVSRALGVEAGYTVVVGGRARAERLVAMAGELRQRYGMQTAPFDRWAAGAIEYFITNRWRRALAEFEDADREVRSHFQSGGWVIVTMQTYRCFCHLYLGDFAALSRLVPSYIREAERRGDQYASVNLRTRLNAVWLAADDPDTAEWELEDAVATWSSPSLGFQIQHYWAMYGRCELALYRGEPELADQQLARDLGPLDRSLLLRVLLVRTEVLHLRARVALARARVLRSTEPGAARAQLRLATNCVRKLRGMGLPLADQLAPLIRAGLAHAEGRTERAERLLEQAAEALTAGETTLYAAAARLVRGRLLGGDQGAALATRAAAELAGHEIRNPERFAAILVPGFAPTP